MDDFCERCLEGSRQSYKHPEPMLISQAQADDIPGIENMKGVAVFTGIDLGTGPGWVGARVLSSEGETVAVLPGRKIQ